MTFEQARLHGILGYRQMKLLLYNKYQLTVNAKKLYRILKTLGIQAVIRRKKRKRQHEVELEKRIAPNVLNREFKTTVIGMKYVTDITYIPIPNSMAYLSVLLDLSNSEVVAYKISLSLDSSLSMDVIKILLAERASYIKYAAAKRQKIYWIFKVCGR